MIVYDKLFRLLREQGHTTYNIRKNKLISNASYQRIKDGTGGLDSSTIDRLCRVLNCQPGDLMDYVPEEEVK